MVICNVAKILELVVPLMEHPSETFLATIEEDLMKLIIKYGMTVRFNFYLKIIFFTAVENAIFEREHWNCRNYVDFMDIKIWLVNALFIFTIHRLFEYCLSKTVFYLNNIRVFCL